MRPCCVSTVTSRDLELLLISALAVVGLSDRSSVQHLVQHLPANRGIYRSNTATHPPRGHSLGNNKTAGQTRSDLRFTLVARGGVEPPTFRFSVGRSYQLSYLALGEAL